MNLTIYNNIYLTEYLLNHHKRFTKDSGRSFSAVPELLINLAGRGRRREGGEEEEEEGEGEDSSQ